MKNQLVIYVAVLCTVVTTVNCAIPDYIHTCPHDHKNLSACITESIEALRDHLRVGIPELKVPGLEPLELDPIGINSISEGSRLATNLTKLTVHGASNFKIVTLELTQDKKGFTVHFNVTVPQLYIEGEYEIDSKILFLDLKGKGPFNANASDFQCDCVMKARYLPKDGKRYAQFNSLACDADVGDSSIFLDNLFSSNEVLGKATNEVINEHREVLFEEIKPSLTKSLTGRFLEIGNDIARPFTVEELFP